MADDAVNRIGTILEELGARFELVIEAVSGFGSRHDTLRQELFGQFAEVGSQIRFLSDQIAENRRGITALRSDLGAEMIRLGETLGRTRVEFREQLGSEATRAIDTTATRLTAGTTAAQAEIQRGVVASQDELVREMTATANALKRELATSAESTARKLSVELSKTNKSLQNLAHKFDRFDDRITVQTKDQDQRLKKLERKKSA
ncbi:MAG TPA: hypothetical protein VJX23_06905 [Candidatus Binataceae bacterium]|nr:hypothetical protein [Candidatus Binataceae bacterium]